jgi:hypothetical protein
LHGVPDDSCRNHEEIFRLDLRLMPPTTDIFICLWQERNHLYIPYT